MHMLFFLRSWKKKEIKEEIVVDEGLQQVVKSFINFDDIFETKEELSEQEGNLITLDHHLEK